MMKRFVGYSEEIFGSVVFHSFPFLCCFLPLLLIAFHKSSARWRDGVVLCGSGLFYALADFQHLYILAISIFGNFFFSRKLDSKSKNYWIQGAVAFNILLLCLYKYSGFIASNLGLLIGSDVSFPKLGFPLGVSFFTIQQIMFLMDRHEGLVSHQPFSKYIKFVSFFPSISAGPISRWREFEAFKNPERDHYARALFLFTLGLAKKILIAGNFARWADTGFSSTRPLSFLEAWVTSITYTFQLYFDFSGYSDMAVALGMMFLIALPQNFDSPLKSSSLIEFWKRWHITLSKFITTYLYAPMLRLGQTWASGARRKISFSRAMLATILAMTIAGLWHGPTWTYITFGVFHGLGLVINNVIRKNKFKTPKWAGYVLTFLFVNASFVIFRSQGLVQAGSILHSMFLTHALSYSSFDALGFMIHLLAGSFIAVGIVAVFLGPNSFELTTKFKPNWLHLIFVVTLLLLSLFYMNAQPPKEFLYVDF